MIDVYELACILPETLFGLAVYNHDKQTAEWVSKKPEKPGPWSFKFATVDWFDAEGREYSFNNNEYTVGFTWKILPFSPEALENWRSRRACLDNWAKIHPEIPAERT